MEYDSRFLTKPRNGGVLVFSAGNPCEAHGPALPYDIDTRIAQRAAMDASNLTGATYVGNIPYTTDSIGEFAKTWSPAYMPVSEFLKKTREFIALNLDYYRSFLDVKGIVLVVAHGGIPKTISEDLSDLGVKIKSVFPTMFGTHSDDYEHSCAEYLGVLEKDGLDIIHGVAAKDPEDVFRKWPVLIGLAGFWLYEKGEYLKLYKDGMMDDVNRFRKTRKIRVDSDFGKEIYDKYVAESRRAIEELALD
ncbi:hypothetical protein BVX95_01075 [archaeon D22]|nr:hypothetical protein BVX95_01075 [archaeon D22]